MSAPIINFIAEHYTGYSFYTLEGPHKEMYYIHTAEGRWQAAAVLGAHHFDTEEEAQAFVIQKAIERKLDGN